METTQRNPFAALAAFIIGTLFIVGLALGTYFVITRGLVALPAPQTTVNGQPSAPRPVAPAIVPRISAPAPQQPAQAAPVEQQPVAVPTAAPAPTEWQAPGEAAPAGEPMTDQYKATIQSQDRTNENGEVCMPRSGCTKPGDGGALPWPNGRP